MDTSFLPPIRTPPPDLARREAAYLREYARTRSRDPHPFWNLGDDGIPVPVEAGQVNWAVEHRRIGYDRVEEIFVSTVFLGIPHPDGGSTVPYLFETTVPYLFETMVSGLPEPINSIQRRYRVWSEALAGHARYVEQYVTPLRLPLFTAVAATRGND